MAAKAACFHLVGRQRGCAVVPRINSLLINRDYARLWYGQAVSTVGDFVFDTTVVLWVATVLAKGQSWAPAAVSGVLLSVGVAVILVGPIAGVFVDRWDRRGTMLRTEVVRGALTLGLAVLSFLPTDVLPTSLWLVVVYCIVFALNASGQFFGPARFATIGAIVEGDADRARAAGIGQATQATASIIGPPLAAPLLFTVGVQWALLVNAASYVVSYFAIRSVQVNVAPRQRDSEKSSLRREFVDGLRFFRGNRLLVVVLTITVITQCGTGAVNALDVFFVSENLHASSKLYGVMSMAFGIGAIAGALSAGRVVKWFGARTTTWLMLLVTGVLFFAYGRQQNFWGGIVLLVSFSIPVTVLNTAMSPLLFKATPQEYLGRMLAVFNPINQLASMLSVVAAGWLASTALRDFHGDFGGVHLGRIDTIFGVAAVLIVASGGIGYFFLPHDESAEALAAEAA